MRITTQVLNASMRKAGLPINTVSLLDCMKSSGVQNDNPLSALNKGNTVSTDRKKYEALRKSAENLQQSADELQSEELYKEARESGDTQAVSDYAERLLEHYNQTLKSLNGTTSPLNQFYRQTLKEAAQKEKDQLMSIGITQKKDGTLSLDKNKLKETDADTLEQVLGGSFTEKISFLADKVADNAKANAASASSQYNASGYNYFTESSRYNFWS
ncbi:MAG: hypothetical protein HFI69_03035 [Lachnospiraceae bacterium]|nr:hypothetical protein [Lachnospiraceae bacterium]